VKTCTCLLVVALLSGASPARAQMVNAEHWDMMTSPDQCTSNEYWSFAMSMCLARPARRGNFRAMVMGALFLADVGVSGTRSAHDLAAPNWLMLDGGIDLARWNRLELDAMFTAERWTYPDSGYPLPFQVGEENEHGVPFVDAQHPHSSPLNPDAPLGHHIGQDVGHITSTVIGLSLTLPTTIIEASTFHGREPAPDAVDLPIGAPDSVAARVSQQLGRHHTLAASLAYVHDPEGTGQTEPVVRASVSAYARWNLPLDWRAYATLIWGGISNYDGASWLDSITGEVLFTDWSNALWGRLEILQRTPAELRVMPAPANPNAPDWVGAVTAGYTRKIVALGPVDFSVGASGTLNFMTDTFLNAYGGRPIVSGKLFVEARVIKMFVVQR
jgi:hypothetical protein